MQIKIYDFILTPAEYSQERFDLTQEFDGETKEGEVKRSVRKLGYAMQLESCIDYIIRAQSAKNLGDKTASLNEYIAEYRKIKEEVKQMLS